MLQLVLDNPILVTFFHMLIEEAGIPLLISSGTLLFFVGFKGDLQPWQIVAVIAGVTLATFLGSTLLYVISRKFGTHLIYKYQNILKHLKITPRTIKQLEIAMNNHGVWFLVIARFTPGARILGTIAAGILNMPYLKFIYTVIPTTIVWSTIYLLAGFYLGENIAELVYDLLSNKLLMMAITVSVVLVAIVLIRKARGVLFPTLPAEAPDQEN